jgi:hypothetical protein
MARAWLRPGPLDLRSLNVEAARSLRDEPDDVVVDDIGDYVDALLKVERLQADREVVVAAKRLLKETRQRSGRSGIAGSASPHFDAVEFGVSYPPSIQVSVPFLIDAWVFRQDEREAVAVRATQFDGLFRSGGAAWVARRSTLTVGLEIDSCDVRPASQNIHWTGTSANVSFAVSPRNVVATPNLIGTRVGQVLFVLLLSPSTAEKEKKLRL